MTLQIPDWLKRNRFYKMSKLSDDSEDLSGWHEAREEHEVSLDGPQEPNLIGSQFVEGRHPLHKVFIDLDVEHWYVPSSNEGHAHLYINVDLTPAELKDVMSTLARYGIVGQGWVYQLEGRKENTFRLPNCKKNATGLERDRINKLMDGTW